MIAIIKYKAGNVQSVQNALDRLGVESIVTDDFEIIQSAERVIFPGVGNAQAAMQDIIDKKLDTVITNLQQPVLGICVGMQLLCKNSEEGNTNCLGIFDAEIKLFKSNLISTASSIVDVKNKVPQVGWNNIYEYQSVLLNGLPDSAFIYLVHSYYAPICKHTIGKINYILPYSAALQYKNFYGVQFHPEKSGKVGAQILKNFIELT
jgi:imidazole glycerol-phosphate synthase subunit HisH